MAFVFITLIVLLVVCLSFWHGRRPILVLGGDSGFVSGSGPWLFVVFGVVLGAACLLLGGTLALVHISILNPSLDQFRFRFGLVWLEIIWGILVPPKIKQFVFGVLDTCENPEIMKMMGCMVVH